MLPPPPPELRRRIFTAHLLALVGCEVERDDYPPPLPVERPIDDRLVYQKLQHTLNVILDVLSVVGKVRIGAPVGRREKDLQPAPGRRKSQLRLDRGIDSAAKQWPFELGNESGAEPSHDAEKLPAARLRASGPR